MNIFQYFNQAYPVLHSLRSKLWNILIISSFVFIFLFLFQPFGLNGMPLRDLLLVALGYGLVTLIVMSINYFLIERLFPGYFKEEHWTLFREILWTSWFLFTIGIGNMLFTALIGMASISISQFITFQIITLLVGIWPIAAMVIGNQMRLMKKNLKEAQRLNTLLLQEKQEHPHQDISPVILPSENENESLTLTADDILFIQSAENYNEVFFLKNELVRKQILRGSLKMMEIALEDHDQFQRCHRSFIVNLDQVYTISGNSQGLKLHLNHTEEVIPVARSMVKPIRQQLQKHISVSA